MAKDQKEKTTSIWVKTMQAGGRMRAGLQFTIEAREVDVTEAQLAMIENDPYLAIVMPPRTSVAEKVTG